MTKTVAERLAQYSPVTLTAPIDKLSPGVRASLPHLARALRAIDVVYQRQLGDHVVELCAAAATGEGDEAQAIRFFNGPFDTLDGHAPFVDGVAPMPPGRTLYPADLSAEDFDAYVAAHSEAREALVSPYTAVQRDGAALKTVPYAERYAADLSPIAAALRDAADAMDHEALAEFTRSRADALEGKRDILASDADWVRLKGAPLELVIGPFEVYEDNLKGLKAFYECMLLMVDDEAGAALQSIEDALPQLAAAIPLPAGSKPAVGGMAPLIVADELLTAGEGHAGVMASAFNLPNDPGVRGDVGWKQIMIRNVMRAKFAACTQPIARRVLSEADFAKTSFDAYFFHVVLHEVSHGLGPAYRADGTRVNECCGKWYTPLEEAKADTGALNLLLRFNGKFGIPAMDIGQIGASYFGGFYRSIRFGLHEAHGKANVIQYSYLKEQGAIRDQGGRMNVDPEALTAAAAKLLNEITRLQAEGSLEALEAFCDKYGTPPDELVAAVEGLADLPVDIRPTFPLDTL